MSAVDFWGLAEPAVLKETGPALADQARNHPRPHVPCQTLPRPTGVAAGILACRKSAASYRPAAISPLIPSFHHSTIPASSIIPPFHFSIIPFGPQTRPNGQLR